MVRNETYVYIYVRKKEGSEDPSKTSYSYYYVLSTDYIKFAILIAR
jgi:hypothetical protein